MQSSVRIAPVLHRRAKTSRWLKSNMKYELVRIWREDGQKVDEIIKSWASKGWRVHTFAPSFNDEASGRRISMNAAILFERDEE
jgi:hypothetical protein